MQVVERTHHIDIIINSGSDCILPILRRSYPHIEILDNKDSEPYRGSELEKNLDRNWEENPNLRVNAFRWAQGMTQQQLAEAAGLNRVAISQIETGKRKIGLSVAKKLAPVLGCSYKELL